MRGAMVVMAAALALAGCGSGESGNNAADSDAEAGAGQVASVQEPTPPELTDDPQNGVVPVALPTPVAARSIPAAFHGRWGLVSQDCVSGGGDAKGLMTVTVDRLAFYESRASVDAIRIVGEGRLTADLAFTGEGQSWRRGTALTLVDDGKTLIREEQKPAGAFRYTRCPV